MVSRVAIGKWFNHHRGLATAISSIPITFAFNGAPAFLNGMIAQFGWQVSCLLSAGVIGLGMGLIGVIFYRDNPEECGLVMDGFRDEDWHIRMATKVAPTRKEFTRHEALGTPTFWAFALGTSVFSFVMTAITFHMAKLGAEMGLDRETAYGLFFSMSWYGIGANFLSGWLSDRIKLKWLLRVMLATQAIGLIGLMQLADPLGQQTFIIGMGTTGGLFVTLTTVAWPRFFGREHLGAISGTHMALMVFSSAIAPVTYAAAQQWMGNFHDIILCSWGVPILLLPLTLMAENPQEKIVATPGEPGRFAS